MKSVIETSAVVLQFMIQSWTSEVKLVQQMEKGSGKQGSVFPQ